jgi:primosomal protein N' (replication factor Y)
VFAPLPVLAAVVVVDEHDEGLQNESSPTWHAREVAIERARRAGVPCLLVSPCPSLEALASATSPPAAVPAGERRAGWVPPVVVDRRGDDPRTGLFSSTFVEEARRVRAEGDRVVCILNRTGRVRLSACRSCGTIAECEQCGAAVRSPDGEVLECGRCGTVRPVVCLECGSAGMKALRVGITRAAEELEALLREPVSTLSAGSGTDGASDPDRAGAGVVMGTEAALHRVRSAGLVAFCDFDQELMATRYRAAEEALSLVVAACRLLGGRGDRRDAGSGGGRLLLQTRRPTHAVVQAATRADPSLLSAVETARRELLGLPPAAAVAAVGGEAAGEWVARLGEIAEPLELQGPRDGWWLLRAPDPTALADACASVSRPPGRLRLRVDPVRLP